MANRNGGTASKARDAHERAGTFRKDRHGDLRNPEPTPGRPKPPMKLDKASRRAWTHMLWAFEDMGMLHRVDVFAVYQYARLYSETEAVAEQQSNAQASIAILEANIRDVKAEELVQLFGQIVILRKLVSKCTDQLRQGRMSIRQYLIDFGLTPSSRGRIKLPGKREHVDEFTAFQKQRGIA